jgi:AraC-like DNA-binding protein
MRYFFQNDSVLNNKNCYKTEPIQIGTASEDELFGRISHLMEITSGRITRAELADQLHYSGNYINQIVNKFTGMSIFEYGTSIVMQKTEYYLASTDQTISQIIELLGYSDRTHFYKLFEKEFGMTPREYRKSKMKKE